MKTRWVAVTALVALALAAQPAAGAVSRTQGSKAMDRRDSAEAGTFTPAVAAQQRLGRYFVVMRGPAVADAEKSATRSGARLAESGQQAVFDAARRSQEAAISETESLGGRVVYRYGTLINGFSAQLSPSAANALAQRPDVEKVEPVGIVALAKRSSVSFVGATKVWHRLGVKGQGMRVADVDTGIDYTHKDFGGPGTVAAYKKNDPTVIEPGTFPTKKVIGGTDLVGDNYDVLDDDPTNDIPRPDPDPLDFDGHGTHTAGTMGGSLVGVAKGVHLIAVRVLDCNGSGSSSGIVAGIDWVTANAASLNIKVANMSLGGTGSRMDSCPTTADPEHAAICRSTDAGITYAVAAGNSGWDFDYAPAPDVPAAYPEALTVAAVTDSDGTSGGTGGAPACRTSEVDDRYASFSNYAATSAGSNHVIAAPGTCITSTWMGGGYDTISGTSMATPH
ncbi:MAG: S8 family serine peptidase, partial [Actinomycetota bacterium]|nr:S8 family serine peptidase [Actinomycetota bacterium]